MAFGGFDDSDYGNFFDFNAGSDNAAGPGGFEGSDNYTDPNAPAVWQTQLEGKSAWQNTGTGLNSYGVPQSRLENLWNQTQGNTYPGQYDALGQMSNMQKQLDGNWYLTKGADGAYGLMPKMDHGWNQEFLTNYAMPIISAFGGALGSLGSAGEASAATSGAELGASFGELPANASNFGSGFGLDTVASSGFDGAYGALGNAGMNTGTTGSFNEEGLGNYKTPDTASGGGIGGSTNGTSLTGGDGKPSKEQTQLQKDFLKLAGNQVQPGLGNAAAAGGSAMDSGNGLWGTGLTAQDIGNGLMGLYGMSQANKNLGGIAKNLGNMYGPNSPYADELRKQLMRKDAAGGRRSQYGPREVELQAKLAQQYSQNAPHLMQAQNQLGANRMAMGTNLMNMGMKALPMLKNLWSTDSAPTGDQFGQGVGFGQMPQGNNFDQGFGMNYPLDGDFNMGFGFDQQQPNLGSGYFNVGGF